MTRKQKPFPPMALGLLLALALSGAPASAEIKIGDEIVLKSGKRIQGFVIHEDEKSVVVKKAGGSSLTFMRADVKEIIQSPSSSPQEKEADVLYAKQEYDAAIEAYQVASTKTSEVNALARIKEKMDQTQAEIEKQFLRQFDQKRKKARALAQSEKYEEAVALLREVQAKSADSQTAAKIITADIAWVYCTKAESLIDKIRDSDAMIELNKAIEVAPHYYDSYILKGGVLWRESNMTSETAHTYARGLALGAEELSAEEKIDINFRVANIYRDSKMPEQSIKHYLEVIAQGRSDQEVISRIAEAYEAMAEDFAKKDAETIAGVIKGLERAIELNPTRLETRKILGRIYLQTEDYDLAVETLKAATAINSQAPGFHLMLGRAYLGKQDLESAELALNHEIRISSQNYESYIIRGQIYLDWKKFGAAVADCNKALTLVPNYYQAYEIIAEAHFRNENWLDAKDWFVKILTQKPNNLDAQLRLAQIDLEQESYSSARGKLAKIREELAAKHELTVDDGAAKLLAAFSDREKRVYAECLTNEGEILLTLDSSPRAAIENHKQALDFIPKFAAAYSNMGTCYQDLSDYENAEKALIAARDFEPLNPDKWMELGTLYIVLKRTEETKRHYREYILRGGRDWPAVRDWLEKNGVPETEIPESPRLKEDAYNLPTDAEKSKVPTPLDAEPPIGAPAN